jgi:hypothetical protein
MAGRTTERRRWAVMRDIGRRKEAVSAERWAAAARLGDRALLRIDRLARRRGQRTPILLVAGGADFSTMDPADCDLVASLCYSQALVHTMLGRLDRAVLDARTAYLVRAEYDPSGGDPRQVAAALCAAGGRPDREQLIGDAADSAAQFARMVTLARLLRLDGGVPPLRVGRLAEVDDPVDVAGDLARDAALSCRELVRHGTRYTSEDLRQVEAERDTVERQLRALGR